uniref:Ribosome biogenesis protein BMS1/TSR1 C-terminal domain-containing protein n=2 Tax=Palpitomonas bilix TaxID=652834 RepID=A0A7S3CYP3_9EUKA
MRFENRMTVVHFKVQRSGEYDEPIKSKTPMVMSSGFRRFIARPIYSTHSSHMDKHKFERFWQKERFCVASIYAPAHMVPESTLLFLKREDTGSEQFVGSGSVLSCDPNRIILRRIVLAGFPFKVHKRKSVVRFMFFNRDDIRWFKPVDLWTKRGRRGHILDSIGSHGYMKCVFDQTVQHHDTVCMSLYKRTFPKWEGEVPVVESTYHV